MPVNDAARRSIAESKDKAYEALTRREFQLAEAFSAKAVSDCIDLGKANPTDALLLAETADCHGVLGTALLCQGKAGEAAQNFQTAVSGFEMLCKVNPAVAGLRVKRAHCKASLGSSLVQSGEREAGRSKFMENIREIEQALAQFAGANEASVLTKLLQASKSSVASIG